MSTLEKVQSGIQGMPENRRS